jgi:hypothetical protein
MPEMTSLKTKTSRLEFQERLLSNSIPTSSVREKSQFAAQIQLFSIHLQLHQGVEDGLRNPLHSGWAGPHEQSSASPHGCHFFFFTGLITVGLFCLMIARDKETKLPKWLLIPGLIAAMSLAAFMAYPWITRQTPAEIIKLYHSARPDIGAVAILEWLVFITVTTWIILVSACLWVYRATEHQSENWKLHTGHSV